MVGNKASKLLEKAAAQIKRSTSTNQKSGYTSFTIPNNNSDLGRSQHVDSNDGGKFVTSTPQSGSKFVDLSEKHAFDDTTIRESDLSRIKTEENDDIPSSKVKPRAKSGSVSRSSAKSEYDEIQAYLQNLSKKTKTEVTSGTKDTSGHDGSNSIDLSKSDLSLTLSELSIAGKVRPQLPTTHSPSLDKKELQSTKVSVSKENASAATTSRAPPPTRLSSALEKASFYDGKYRKAKGEQSKKDILDSDSDFSFNEFKTLESPHRASPSVPVAVEVPASEEDVQKEILSDPLHNLADDMNKPSPLMQLHNLHTVEELLESLDASAGQDLPESTAFPKTVVDRTQSTSDISEEFEELEESISEALSDDVHVSKASDDGKQAPAERSESSVPTVSVVEYGTQSHQSHSSEASEHVAQSSSETDLGSSGQVFKNVYLHSLEDGSLLLSKASTKDADVARTESSSTLIKSIAQTEPSYSEIRPPPMDPQIDRLTLAHHIEKKHADAAVQTIVGTTSSLTDLLMNPPLVNYTCELEQTATYAAVTRYIIRQETVEALLSSSPAILAATDLMQQQLMLTTQFLASQQNLYMAHVNALQPDYEYTTWRKTKEEIRRRRRKLGLPVHRHEKKKK